MSDDQDPLRVELLELAAALEGIGVLTRLARERAINGPEDARSIPLAVCVTVRLVRERLLAISREERSGDRGEQAHGDGRRGHAEHRRHKRR
jgi:hypothetical protein